MEIIKGTNTAEFKRLYDDFAQSVFDVSFMPWFKLDVWTDDCEIYCMVHEDKIIANVSVYKMRMRVDGKKKSAIQLGAVGTLPQYRRQHISKQLMEYVFEKYKSVPAFLVANSEVKDFYPKFGFKLLEEKIPVTLPPLKFKPNRMVKIKYAPSVINEYLKNRVALSKRLQVASALPIVHFHIAVEFYEDIYYIADFDMIVIAKQFGNILRIFDMITRMYFTFDEIAPYLDFKGVEKIEFMFQPDAIIENYFLQQDVHSEEYGLFFVKNIEFKHLDKYPYILST